MYFKGTTSLDPLTFDPDPLAFQKCLKYNCGAKMNKDKKGSKGQQRECGQLGTK